MQKFLCSFMYQRNKNGKTYQYSWFRESLFFSCCLLSCEWMYKYYHPLCTVHILAKRHHQMLTDIYWISNFNYDTSLKANSCCNAWLKVTLIEVKQVGDIKLKSVYNRINLMVLSFRDVRASMWKTWWRLYTIWRSTYISHS